MSCRFTTDELRSIANDETESLNARRMATALLADRGELRQSNLRAKFLQDTDTTVDRIGGEH